MTMKYYSCVFDLNGSNFGQKKKRKRVVMDKRIILASGSPRRKELLEMLGLKFEVMVSNQEESYTSTHPKEIVKELALKKARHVAYEVLEQASLEKEQELTGEQLKDSEVADAIKNKEVIIIGADTIVVVTGQVLEKPEDETEAFEMIGKLQNNVHQVYTGVALLKKSSLIKEKNEKNDGSDSNSTPKWLQRINFVVETKVFVSPMTEDEIWDYIRTGESLDKAGGYGIQGGFAKFIEKIDGDFYNVMGLPVAKLYQEMKKML